MYFGFEDISIQYDKKKVIEALSAGFEKGKITTIIGKNGCGKSSLLKTVSKAVTPSGGKVVLLGKPLKSYKAKHLARKIAYLPQVHFSPPDIDVRTLVSYGRYPHMKFGRGLTKEDGDAVDRAVQLTGLDELRFQHLSTLSGGERQRAWIAMSICQEPEILILDEPTTYLDVGFQIEVLDTVKALNETLGITVIMVLHDLNMAARYSDCLCAVKNRRICARGSPREILTPAVLEDVFNIQANVFTDTVNRCPYFIPLKKVHPP
ncbi:MAG: ABC transporter ATP-binding protein [Clostridiales bacterium]|jgi:iron complex transport system ATP-binding protein|nr:ABC transporter ATP-binding protein [Clostridiales bacterium]